jgi:hypothetical protein
MKYLITLAGVFFVGLASSAHAQTEGSATTEKGYRSWHRNHILGSTPRSRPTLYHID